MTKNDNNKANGSYNILAKTLKKIPLELGGTKAHMCIYMPDFEVFLSSNINAE